jgi:hypothetical protein
VNVRTLAWVAWTAWTFLAGLAILLQLQTTQGFPAAWAPALTLGTFMTVGTVIVFRQPYNTIGWLCYVAGLAGALAGFSGEYARYALGLQGDWLPGGLAMAWLNMWVGIFWAGMVPSLLLLLFPTGRLPSPRWRPVAWASAVCVSAACVVRAVKPGPLQISGQPNPLGIDRAQAILERLGVLVTLCLVLLMLLCAASVVLRFRRARGVERQQLKWFAAGAGQLALLSAVAIAFPGFWDRWVSPAVSDLVFGISFAMIPLTIGIAILRYRLYDIDRLINRTLVYGLLTTLLAVVYAGLVLVLGQLFGGVGRDPPSWVVAGATLGVAALFQPARRRIQAVVDRRFNRRRYDATRTIEAFSRRLRDEIELDTLSAELVAVVDQTMQPTAVSLWLKSAAESPRDSWRLRLVRGWGHDTTRQVSPGAAAAGRPAGVRAPGRAPFPVGRGHLHRA